MNVSLIGRTLLAFTILLTGCAGPPTLDEFRLDWPSVTTSVDAQAMVAMGTSADAFVVVRVRGCAEGRGEIDY
jgi:hypothetical protein